MIFDLTESGDEFVMRKDYAAHMGKTWRPCSGRESHIGLLRAGASILVTYLGQTCSSSSQSGASFLQA